jgi:hypothetical protein
VLDGLADHSAVSSWCPRAHPLRGDAVARITLSPAVGGFDSPPSRERDLAWGRVRAWMQARAPSIVLASTGLRGTGDIAAGAGTLALRDNVADDEVHGALLLLAGVLLAGRGRLLVHAGAVLDDAGGAWLLVGDSHAGKSTTVATLSAAGRGWVSDDTVVLSREGSTVVASGWVRAPHLDAGWARREVLGQRVALQPDATGPFALAQWTPAAPVVGVLLPQVVAEAPTRLEPASDGDAFAALMRQGPWGVVQSGIAAADTIALLSRVAALPTWRLQLGRDSYGKATALEAALTCALSPRELLPFENRR